MPLVYLAIIIGIFVFMPGCTVERVEATDVKQRKWLIECRETQYTGTNQLLAGAKCSAYYIKDAS